MARPFSFWNDVPEWAEEIPGVWKNKKSSGYRVPHNTYDLLDSSLSVEPEDQVWNRIERAPSLLPWVPDFLLPHQKNALLSSVPRLGFHVWAPPGAGKTLVGLVWAAATIGPRIVVTRAAARGTWKEEARKYTTFKPVLLTGKKPKELSRNTNILYITAWETLIDWQEAIEELKPYSIVFDEIHAAKNPKRSKRVILPNGKTEYEDLGNMASAAYRIASSCSRRLGLTATPIPNRPRDLWAQLDLCEPWQWGTFHQFGMRYCAGYKDAYGHKYDGLSQQTELNKRLRFCKHKTSQASVNVSLPPKRRQVVYLSHEEQNRASGGFKKELKQARDRESFFEVLLQEAATRKRKYILQRVEDAVRSGQKIIVFTGRRKDCDKLSDDIVKHLGKNDLNASLWAAHGGTNTAGRDEIRHEYMACPGPAILVGTGDAWGESVNLQDTDLALFVMLPWTPGKIRQWEGRVRRLGQKRPVLISYVVAEGTADEHVADILLDKLPAVGQVVEDEALSGLEESFETDKDDLLARVGAVAAMVPKGSEDIDLVV